MTGVLFHLARFCGRHKVVVLGVWLVIFAALAVAARSVGHRRQRQPDAAGHRQPDARPTCSTERFPSQANGTNPVVLQRAATARRSPPRSTRSRSTTRSRRSRTIRTSAARRARCRATARRCWRRTSAIGYIALNLKPSPSELTTDDAERIVDARRSRRAHAGLEVGFGGYVGQKVSKPETAHQRGRSASSMAVIVLLFTFGTVVAMGAADHHRDHRPGLRAVDHHAAQPRRRGADRRADARDDDRARRRDRLRAVHRHPPPASSDATGMETRESIARATATSGGAVVFAGCTVMVALLSLAVVDIPLVTTLGYTSALVVAVAVLAAITLLPAILGDRRRPDRPAAGSRCRTARRDDDHARLAALGRVRRPPPAARRRSSRLVVLVALALPALDLYLGQQDNGALPESTEARKRLRRAHRRLRRRRQRPAAGQRRHVEASRPRPTRRRSTSSIRRAGRQGQGEPAGDAGAADRRAARGAGHAAGPGAAAGQPQRRQAARRDPKAVGRQRKKARAARRPTRGCRTCATTSRRRAASRRSPSRWSTRTAPRRCSTSTPTTGAVRPRDGRARRPTLRDDTIPKATKGKDMTADVGGTTAGYVDLADEICEQADHRRSPSSSR